MDTQKVSYLSEKNPPIAKQSKKDRSTRDPWRGLRERPGVVVKDVATKRSRP